MRVYAALYHAFMPPLYAGTLYQGLYQVYATRAPLGFIPSRSSSCKSLQHKKTSSTSPPYPQIFINPSILSNMSVRPWWREFRSVRMSSVRPWWREVFSGTFFLMNSVLPVCLMLAYAMALFRFMLVLCNARGLSWLCLGPA